MRVYLLAAVTALGMLGASPASAVPANGIVLDQAAAAVPLTQEARWYWHGRHWRRHWHHGYWHHRRFWRHRYWY